METLGRFLIEHGGLWGALVMLEAAAITWLAKEVRAEHRERLNDAKENTKAMMAITDRVYQAIEAVSDHLETQSPRRLPTKTGRMSRPE